MYPQSLHQKAPGIEMPNLIYPRHGPTGPEINVSIDEMKADAEVDGALQEITIRKAEVSFPLDRAKVRQLLLFLLPYALEIKEP